MKCHVPGQNVKIFGRTVHALARFGDELYIESLPERLVVRTMNAAESAYACVKFHRSFFSSFVHDYYHTEDDEGLKCKISMRSALNAFKSPAHLDKQVENFEMVLEPETCKLILRLSCKHGIVKTHYVSILDCKAMQAVYTVDLVPNRITAHQKVLMEAINNFQNSDDQVTLEVTSQTFLLRNYIDDDANFSKITRTQVKLKPTEFENYVIGVDTHITFTLKEFRALLMFAESLNLPLQLNFETTGKPAVFIVHNGTTFEANFVLATAKADTETQADSTQSTNMEELRKKRTHNCNSSEQGSARKKLHTDKNTSKPVETNNASECIDRDEQLFNFVDIPDGNMQSKSHISKNTSNNNHIDKGILNGNEDLNGEHDNIPPSPTAKMKIHTVFRRCFERTIDAISLPHVVLAENSDSE